MAEPSSTTAAAGVASAITLTSLLTGLDPNLLIGSAAGASLFVMSANDLGIMTRLIYLCISLGMGYIGGEAVLGHIFGEPAVSAFVFSACVVGIGQKLIKGVDKIDINNWLRPPK